jgi:hypothetical protein
MQQAANAGKSRTTFLIDNYYDKLNSIYYMEGFFEHVAEELMLLPDFTNVKIYKAQLFRGLILDWT